MTPPDNSRDGSSMKAGVLRQVFGHCDCLALGAVAQGLLEGGVLDALAGNSGPHDLAELAKNHGLVPGFTMVALETMAAQGLCRIEEGRADFSDPPYAPRLTMTDEGRRWLGHRETYRGYDTHLKAARAGATHILEEETDCLAHAHLAAPYITALMSSIGAGAKLEPLAAKALINQGWVNLGGDHRALTFEGELAMTLAGQYDYAGCYFSLLEEIPRLLKGALETSAGVDRELDIELSGQVFKGPCRDLFFKQILPLFDREDLSAQPRAIVDTGCGDATVLVKTFKAIGAQTRRGKSLVAHPLIMVGVEYEQVARDRARQALQSSGVPHLVISGDISDPDAIAASLSRQGIDPEDILHISKSVIHNRRFIKPGAAAWLSTLMPVNKRGRDGFHVRRDGSPIFPGELFKNLEDFFGLWIPWISRHGMIAIESHCWPASLCAGALGRYPMTLLKTTHGFSSQYLVGADFYRCAAISAGLISLRPENIFTVANMPATMTIDHFLPKQSLGLDGLL